MSFFGGRRQVEPPPAAPQRPEPPPAAPAPSQTSVGFETVLGANSVLEGTLRSSANVRLDGTFTGTLDITGNVLVGETARINADINARNISIAGAVRGNVSGKKVQLLRTGRIWGDIRAQALTTEEGAFIDGKITMVGQEQPPVEAAPPSEVTPAVEPSFVPEPGAPVLSAQTILGAVEFASASSEVAKSDADGDDETIVVEDDLTEPTSSDMTSNDRRDEPDESGSEPMR